MLVAEDNQINLLFIETVLMGAGYRVSSAKDGVEALSLLERQIPDLVLMDIQMPRMDGLECARRIRADSDSRLRSLPIVALTGYAMAADRSKCFEAGMDAFLAKPFDGDALLSAVALNARR